MTDPFVHLHVHTVYSLLDGFSNIKKLVKRAKELEMPALAITDHGTMFGVIEFFNAARDAGIKPIIGIETYMAARTMKDRDAKLDKKSSHLLLLAENEVGYKNLLAIASAAQLEGFYYYPRTDHEFLAAHSEGLIATSGCMGAEIPRTLLEDNPQEAVRRMNWYYDVFGPERFFIELQSHNIKELTDLNKKLVEMGAKHSAKFVATNDVHYIEQTDAKYQDVLLAIQTGTLLKDENRMRMTDPSYYLRTPQEMATLFAEIPEALSNTVAIAERCAVDLSFKGYHLPEFPVPAGFDAESYLRKLCAEGAERRYGADAAGQRVRERLDYELGVIHTMGFDAYFLIVWDLCRYAREKGIWYNTRGSAAGSIVAYTLDITMVDPIHHGLIFERFLNPGRISMPDIDLDFRDDLRSKMLEYCAKKYGDDKVAQIITFGTMAARGALRDVGRVMEIPIPEVDRVAKLIPNVPGKPVSLSEALEQVPDLKAIYNAEPRIKELIETALHMEGTVRNAGTHAAGVVISDKPLTEYLPIHRPTSGSEESPIKTVTQFEMGILDGMGMLKVDFLGLSTLTVMARACALINERHNVNYDLTNIPVDDPEAFKLYGTGQTAGVFQVEGCLSGDTYIGHRTIKELYEDFKAREKAGSLHGRQLLRANSCYLDEGRFNYNLIVKAVYSGVKPVYRLSADNHCWIKATADHHFFTQRGWVPLGQLDSQADRLLFKRSASRAGRFCIECGKPMKSVSNKAQRCGACAAHLTSNPSRPEVRKRIAHSKLGDIPWNKGLTAETAADTLWIKNLSIYNETQKGVSLEVRHGPEKAAQMKANLSARFSGKGNPMYGRPPKTTKTYTNHGYREDLGHYVRSSWEADMARVFLYLGWEYQYEPRTFELTRTDGATFTYTPDFFIPSQDTYYEIKGWMDRVSAEKIALFQQQYPECKLVVIDKTLFAEFQVQYATLVKWECPQFPSDSEWVQITAIEFAGEEDTYDLQMLAPGNNFVANGFVVHNSGMTRWMIEMKPKNLDNIIAMVALYRPGPLDFIPSYIKRMHGEEPVKYLHPAMEPIFSDTFGIPIYQEQIMRAAVELGGYSASESDELRKAISKKQADKIAKHKDKFIKGAVARSMLPETASAIFTDWEEFARYGFNKSHAANYGVISVQTAFLKAHYPAEYMSALMSVFKDDAAKIAMYAADSRAMGIAVLPPDINHSKFGFTIEDKEGHDAIRFSLGAIKNVGQGPVDILVEARKAGPFNDLNDFARRVDLRSVGKRALECLIKVGAMDCFGNRAALLAALDHIVSASSSHFRAIEAGQMSLFGGDSGVQDENIILPAIQGDRKEMLNWERELIGLYLSDHPLSIYTDLLTKAVSHNALTLTDARHEEQVRVAGMVAAARPYKTKSDKMMGFVTLEDMTGNIELVIFPRTWEKFRDLCVEGKVIVVDGKVDAANQPPKVLVDAIRTDVTYYESPDLKPDNGPQTAGRGKPTPPPPAAQPSQGGSRPSVAVPRPPAPVSISPPPVRITEPAPAAYAAEPDDDLDDDMPPPPEAPPEWETYSAPAKTYTAPATPLDDMLTLKQFDHKEVKAKPAQKVEDYPVKAAPLQAGQAPRSSTGTAPALETQPVHLPPIAPPPLAEPAPDDGQPPRLLTIFLRPSADSDRDRRRIKHVYGILISHHGQDRFQFQIFENGRGHLIDFPNDTTRIAPEMLERLKKLVGDGAWRIEEITFQ